MGRRREGEALTGSSSEEDRQGEQQPLCKIHIWYSSELDML